MPVKTHVERNAGHPWDGRSGFDVLHVQADTEAGMAVFLAAAKKRFWSRWLIGTREDTGLPGDALFKLCDIAMPWEHSQECRRPGCVRAESPS